MLFAEKLSLFSCSRVAVFSILSLALRQFKRERLRDFFTVPPSPGTRTRRLVRVINNAKIYNFCRRRSLKIYCKRAIHALDYISFSPDFRAAVNSEISQRFYCRSLFGLRMVVNVITYSPASFLKFRQCHFHIELAVFTRRVSYSIFYNQISSRSTISDRIAKIITQKVGRMKVIDKYSRRTGKSLNARTTHRTA